MRALLCGLGLLLTACATPQIAKPQEPSYGVMTLLPGEKVFHVTEEKKENLVKRGIPEKWFTEDSRGWAIDPEHETEAANILANERNP